MSDSLKGRWRAGTFVLDGSVVGTVSQGASGDWFAWGCMDDWEDTRLGSFEDETEARARVEEWVEEHTDDD